MAASAIRLRINPSLLPQEVEFQQDGADLQYRYVGTSTWITLGQFGATLTIGTVSTLGPNDAATVENVGTPQNAVLNIGIPAGSDGLVQTIEPDTGIGVDATDPNNPIITLRSSVATLTDLKAISVPTVDGSTVLWMEGYHVAGDGGGGAFRWNSSSLTNAVAADPLCGLYVPPDSDATGASGAWVRLPGTRYSSGGGVIRNEGFRNVRWFGAKGDNSTDDAASIQAAIDHCMSASVGSEGFGGTIYIPAGIYKCSTAIYHGIGMKFFGDKISFGAQGSTLYFYNGTHGLVNYIGTLVQGEQMANVVIRDLAIRGANTTHAADGTKGVWTRVNPDVEPGENTSPGSYVFDGAAVDSWDTCIDLNGQMDEAWMSNCQIGNCRIGMRSGWVQGVYDRSFFYDCSVYHIDAPENTATYKSLDLGGVSANFDTGTAKGINLRVADTYTVSAIALTDPIRITTSGAHKYVTGETVTFTGVGGTTELNGNWYEVEVIDSTHFDLVGKDGTTGYGTFTSGGTTQSERGSGQNTKVMGIMTAQDIQDAIVIGDGVVNPTIVGNSPLVAMRHAIWGRGASSGAIILGNVIDDNGTASNGVAVSGIEVEGTCDGYNIDGNRFGSPSTYGTIGVNIGASVTNTHIGDNSFHSGVTVHYQDASVSTHFAREEIAHTTTLASLASSTTETSLYSKSLPANTLIAGRRLHLVAVLDYQNNTGGAIDLTLKGKLGSTTFFNAPITGLSSSSTRRFITVDLWLNVDTSSVCHGFGRATVGTTNVTGTAAAPVADFVGGHTSVSETLSGALTLDLTGQHSTSSSSASVRLQTAHVELF